MAARENRQVPLSRSVQERMEEGFSDTGVLLLAILLVLLSLILVLLVIHIIIRRRQMDAQGAGGRRRRNRSHDHSDEALQQRMNRRYETIEGWMVSKRVIPNDEFCQKILSFISNDNVNQDPDSHLMKQASPTIDLEASFETISSSVSSISTSMECPICLEKFSSGQIVSFSANSTCSHVFHHKCIKEWLLRHTNCPFCRTTCMQTDLIRGKNHNQEILAQHMLQYHTEHRRRAATTLFCENVGLITLPLEIHCTGPELEQITALIGTSLVNRQMLATLRTAESDNNSEKGGKDSQLDVASHDHVSDPHHGGSESDREPVNIPVIPVDVLDDDSCQGDHNPLMDENDEMNAAGAYPDDGLNRDQISQHIISTNEGA